MIRLLLDTHLLIWVVAKSGRLPAAARALIEAPENTILFSPISIWEIATKLQLRRPDFDLPPDAVAESALAAGFIELRSGWRAAVSVLGLPMHHRDPFDRMLIAQAVVGTVPLYTVDERMAAYGSPVHPV